MRTEGGIVVAQNRVASRIGAEVLKAGEAVAEDDLR
ncbi:hypothetical protein BRAO375_1030021 [Bradyrhizobium sp. ORS 375]|nr:hypothetical protein BRAO375_1030021 [Bradyrhizobium sp. ORS 375]